MRQQTYRACVAQQITVRSSNLWVEAENEEEAKVKVLEVAKEFPGCLLPGAGDGAGSMYVEKIEVADPPPGNFPVREVNHG